MNNWTAIVPLKTGSHRKSRLASQLSSRMRDQLGEQMALHVLRCLREISAIKNLLVLSPTYAAGLNASWIRDEGTGLNHELAMIRASHANESLLVIHADLPLLQADDVVALINAAELRGNAIAPDRHRTGTNALALGPGAFFPFAFGFESFRAHLDSLGDKTESVEREGLAFDLDTPDDLRILKWRGIPVLNHFRRENASTINSTAARKQN